MKDLPKKQQRKWTLGICTSSLFLTLINLLLQNLSVAELTWLAQIVAFTYILSFFALISYCIRLSVDLIRSKKKTKGIAALTLTSLVFLNPISLIVLVEIINFVISGEIILI